MERRTVKLLINRAGGTASKNSKTYKVSLPTTWINELNLSEENKNLELSFDGKQIIITPVLNFEDFISNAKKKNHKILLLNYFNGDELCTKIAADFDEKKIQIENFSKNCIHTAFGVNENPSWEDYESFLEERCVPKSRMGIKEYLISIGVDEYNPLEIIKVTEGRMAEDNHWIKLEEL